MGIMEKVPENIRIYIQEISERMTQGRAVVMVGSGFSKNAKNRCYTEKKFVDWNQLGDIFYKKLYTKLPSEEENPCYYHDPLKLAGKVEQCFGRTILDKLILDSLPDEEYEPSELHEALLRLNWTDIFTTNYDTLLERTRARVFNNRYQVVLSKEDLVYSKCPRIIKLHGSFPSTRPFIVTEEDYRKYPREFAVFVNTVRQALIENVMCMIGFSGDDPNFLNWLGWIRDYLGRAASKIYMVGVFDIGEVERKLYDSHNIIVINMKECSGIEDGKYEDGLKLFFEAVEFFQKEEEEDKYFYNCEKEVDIEKMCCQSMMLLKKQPTNFVKDVMENLRMIADEWSAEREDGIDWFVVPYQRRRKIEKTLRLGEALLGMLYTGESFESMKYVIGKFLYEYNWRREKCFLPLESDGACTYEEYLSLLKEEWKGTDIELGFSLLEYLREHGEFDKWKSLVSQMEDYMDDTKKMRLSCEKAMKMLYNLECGDLSNVLVDLSGSFDRVGLEFKISSLLAELGYYERAILLLKKNLDEVRKQIGNNIDYYNFSREAYLIDLLENLKKYYDHLSGVKDVGKDIDSRSRLKVLKSYDCNPEYERDYLIQQLISYMHNADSSCSLIEGANPEKYIKFMENTGMVFRSAYFFEYTDEFPVLLKGLVRTNPYLAMLCTFRYGEKAVCERIWDKDVLEGMETDTVDRLIKQCIKVCENNEKYLRSEELNENNLAINLPELAPFIIAGLVQKASINGSYGVIEFTSRILESSNGRYCGIKEMLKAVVLRLSELKPKDLLICLMEFPLGYKEKKSNKRQGEVMEPFLYMDLMVSDVDVPDGKRIEILKQELESGVKDCKWTVYARLLVTEIICNLDSVENGIFLDIENEVLECPDEFYELVVYHKAKYGKQETKIQVKREWKKMLENQIDQFTNKGGRYYSDFQREIGKLQKKIKFFRKKCVGFSWNYEDMEWIITILGKWADAVHDNILALCNNILYYNSWHMLEIILLEIFSMDKIEWEMKNCSKLQFLEEKLKRIQIPFLLWKVLIQWNAGNFEEADRLLFSALMKGGYEQAEAERILDYVPQLQMGELSSILNG